MRASLVLHPGARAALNGAVLGILLLHRRGVLQHVEHAIVLIRRLRRRLLRLLLVVAAVRLVLRLGRTAILPSVLLLVLVLVLVLIVLFVVFFAAVLVLILAGIRLVAGVGLAAVVSCIRRLRVFLFVFLVLDATKRDRAVVRGVAADAVARVFGDAGHQTQRRVVLFDRGFVIAAQEFQVARQVVGSGAELDGSTRVGRDQAHHAQRAVDAFAALRELRILLGGRAGVTDRFFFTEALAETLGQFEQPESEIEARVGALAHGVRRADLAVFAFARREVAFEQRHRTARVPGVVRADRLIDGRRVTFEQRISRLAARGDEDQRGQEARARGGSGFLQPLFGGASRLFRRRHRARLAAPRCLVDEGFGQHQEQGEAERVHVHVGVHGLDLLRELLGDQARQAS